MGFAIRLTVHPDRSSRESRMYSATVNIDPLVAICWESISAIGWCEPNLSLTATSALQTIQNKLCDEPCVFRALFSLDRENESSLKLTSSARSFLQQLTQTGLSLLIYWPRVQGRAVDEWLGRRFYFSASTNFAAAERYVSLVSSQLGRNGSKIPSWPTRVAAQPGWRFSHCYERESP